MIYFSSTCLLWIYLQKNGPAASASQHRPPATAMGFNPTGIPSGKDHNHAREQRTDG